jgi:hypothetical protein
MKLYWPAVFPNIEEDILTQKRTILHVPYSYSQARHYSVGDNMLILNLHHAIIANATITSISKIKLMDITLGKLNVSSFHAYCDRLDLAYSKYNLTLESELKEIEFEYNPPLAISLIRCYVDGSPKALVDPLEEDVKSY